MILVLFLLLFLSLIILFSYIKIELKDAYISNIPEFHYNFKLNIKIYLFNKIKIFSIKIDSSKLRKSKLAQKIQNKMKTEKIDLSFSDGLEIIKKSKMELEFFKTNIKIGTEDIIFTSFIVTILSSLLGIGLAKAIKKYTENKFYYSILPVYGKNNMLDIDLNCIINVKLVHIIYVIYMFSKKRSEKKYERTSNRSSYDYSYE